MKNSMARTSAYIGAGSGLVLFVLFGLLPGSLIGGAAGIKIAGALFGLPPEPGMIPRAIVLLSMLLGVMVTGVTIATAASTTGWLLGKLAVSSSNSAVQDWTAVVRKQSGRDSYNKKYNNAVSAERRSTMKNEMVKTGMKIGAAIGELVFLVFGIMPGFYFGSYGTLILIHKLMGGAVEPTLLVRAAIAMGIVVGIACVVAVSLVVGGLIGSTLGYVVSLPSAMRTKQTVAEKA